MSALSDEIVAIETSGLPPATIDGVVNKLIAAWAAASAGSTTTTAPAAPAQVKPVPPFPVPTVNGVPIEVDPPVTAGTPGTWTSPVTGHTLNMPKPNTSGQYWPAEGSEGLVGYYQRTAWQSGGNPAQAGGIAIMVGGWLNATPANSALGTPVATDESWTNWPYFCDRYSNPTKYMTLAEQGVVSQGFPQSN